MAPRGVKPGIDLEKELEALSPIGDMLSPAGDVVDCGGEDDGGRHPALPATPLRSVQSASPSPLRQSDEEADEEATESAVQDEAARAARAAAEAKEATRVAAAVARRAQKKAEGDALKAADAENEVNARLGKAKRPRESSAGKETASAKAARRFKILKVAKASTADAGASAVHDPAARGSDKPPEANGRPRLMRLLEMHLHQSLPLQGRPKRSLQLALLPHLRQRPQHRHQR